MDYESGVLIAFLLWTFNAIMVMVNVNSRFETMKISDTSAGGAARSSRLTRSRTSKSVGCANVSHPRRHEGLA